MMAMTASTTTDSRRFRRALPDDSQVTRWTSQDGWILRAFDWPVSGRAARGSILFQGGRGDIIEKYLEAMTHWHDAGWTVGAFDWRGQGGSGRQSRDPRVGHAASFEPYLDDLAGYWNEWRARTPGPHVAIGHSMGGHLVLRAITERRIEADAAVLVAPMLGLRSPVGARAGEAFARMMARAGDPTRAAWTGHDRPGLLDRQRLLTADAARYADEGWWYAAQPDLQLGPPSWAWLVEAFASTRRQRADPRLGAIATPLLMLVAEADALVHPDAAIAVASRIATAMVVKFDRESAHEILREADPVRDRALAAIDSFLDDRVPAR